MIGGHYDGQIKKAGGHMTPASLTFCPLRCTAAFRSRLCSIFRLSLLCTPFSLRTRNPPASLALPAWLALPF